MKISTLLKGILGTIRLEGPATQPSFTGTVGSTAPFVPATMNPAPPDMMGLGLFQVVQTRETFPYDTINAHYLGLTDGRAIYVCGNRFAGKTALGQAIAVSLLSRYKSNGARRRLYAEIQRRNQGIAELDKLLHRLGGEITTLKGGGINLLAPNLLPITDQTDLIKRSLELLSRTTLTARQGNMLTHSMKLVYKDKLHVPCLSVLARLLLDVNVEDALSYLGCAGSTRLHHLEEARLLVAASREVAAMVRDLSELGCLGDTVSVEQAMKAQVFAPDFTDLTDEETIILQMYLWRIRMHAIAVHDEDLFFNVEIHDENYKMTRYAVYTQGMMDFLKAIRGADIVVVAISHRPNDYRTVAANGTVAYEQAMNLLNEYDTCITGRLPESSRDDMKMFFGFTDDQFDIVLGLTQPRFVIKFRNQEDIHEVRLRLTRGLRETSYSHGATENEFIPNDEEQPDDR